MVTWDISTIFVISCESIVIIDYYKKLFKGMLKSGKCCCSSAKWLKKLYDLLKLSIKP